MAEVEVVVAMAMVMVVVVVVVVVAVAEFSNHKRAGWSQPPVSQTRACHRCTRPHAPARVVTSGMQMKL